MICCLCAFAASSWINLFLNQETKSKYVAYLYVLETIQIPSQVNTKTTTTTTRKQTNNRQYIYTTWISNAL